MELVMKHWKQMSIVLLACCNFNLEALAGQIITEKEANLPAQRGDLKTRGISRGPGIKILSPDSAVPVRGVFDLRVVFEQRSGHRIDPDSVRITYLKSPVVDLTPRLKSGISEGGIAYLKAEVPQGEHMLRIVVRDIEGRESVSTLTINAQN
jgi:hypothetical protein